jgi:hypothetical protein
MDSYLKKSKTELFISKKEEDMNRSNSPFKKMKAKAMIFAVKYLCCGGADGIYDIPRKQNLAKIKALKYFSNVTAGIGALALTAISAGIYPCYEAYLCHKARSRAQVVPMNPIVPHPDLRAAAATPPGNIGG